MPELTYSASDEAAIRQMFQDGCAPPKIATVMFLADGQFEDRDPLAIHQRLQQHEAQIKRLVYGTRT